MDAKYLEPLVRRAVQEKFPDSLHTMFEILKRASVLGSTIPTMNGIPGIGENLNDAIRKLIFDNFYTIKGNVSLYGWSHDCRCASLNVILSCDV